MSPIDIQPRPNVWLSLSIAIALVAQPGCTFKQWFVHKTAEPIPRALDADATLQEITDYVNQERSRLIGWRSTDVRITADGEGIVAPKLSANLCVQSPRNLRLVADISGLSREVDFGSNDERFWFWVKRQEPKMMLTGTHAGLDRQQVLPIPFSPTWMMEALGVVPIDTTNAELMRDEANVNHVRLVSSSEQDGRAVRREMVVDLERGQIVEHLLYDGHERLIANARMSDFRMEANGVTLAHHIDLNFPETKTALKLQIGRIEVNPSVQAKEWEMPYYPNYQLVDLDRSLPTRF